MLIYQFTTCTSAYVGKNSHEETNLDGGRFFHRLLKLCQTSTIEKGCNNGTSSVLYCLQSQ